MIRRVDQDGATTTIAGSCRKNAVGVVTCSSGSADGIGSHARFSYPYGIALDATGEKAYIADSGNDAIRVLNTRTYEVSTLAGGAEGASDGQGSAASFSKPYGIAYDPATGVLYVADSSNSCLRRVTPETAVVETIAGVCGSSGGWRDGFGSSAEFSSPAGLAVDGLSLLVADYGCVTERARWSSCRPN